MLARGRELFTRVWLPADPRCRDDNVMSPRSGDGLGPVFNDTSCVACHSLGGVGGAGPREKNVQILVLRKTHGTATGSQMHPGLSDDGSSTVLHRSSVLASYASWRKDRLNLAGTAFEPDVVVHMFTASLPQDSPDRKSIASIAGKLSREFQLQNQRSIRLGDLSFSEPPLLLSERNPPALFGARLIDSISDRAIEQAAESQRRALPRIAGRIGRAAGNRIGRFGWQAQQATLADFTLTACAVELGLTVPGHPQASEPQNFTERVPGLDMSRADCSDLLAFVDSLAAPREQVARADAEMVSTGKRLFDQIGCSDCHRPNLGNVRGIYSDLLLHNMGYQLAGEGGGGYGAFVSIPGALDSAAAQGIGLRRGAWAPARDRLSAFECRTPPLWGVASSAPYLHDGRAATLRDAIVMHAGQGAAAATAFEQLDEEQRQLILIFLSSLVAWSIRTQVIASAASRRKSSDGVERVRQETAGGIVQGAAASTCSEGKEVMV